MNNITIAQIQQLITDAVEKALDNREARKGNWIPPLKPTSEIPTAPTQTTCPTCGVGFVITERREELEIDWTKVPINTPVQCRQNITWFDGYFYGLHTIYYWKIYYKLGDEKMSDLNKENYCAYVHCRLAPGVEINPEWIKK